MSRNVSPLRAALESAKAELGNATRTAYRDPDRLTRARQQYDGLKAEHAIRSLPPLPMAERQRLAAILLDGGND